MCGFSYHTATAPCRRNRKRAAHMLCVFAFGGLFCSMSPAIGQDIGPEILRVEKKYKPDDLRAFEVGKAGYSLGIAPVVNRLTGNLANYFSAGIGADLSAQFFDEKAYYFSFGLRISVNGTRGVTVSNGAFPQLKTSPTGSFSFGLGKRFDKFHFEGAAQLAFFELRGNVPGVKTENNPPVNLNSVMLGAKISYPLKPVLGIPKVVFGNEPLPHYHETRMNLLLGFYQGVVFNRDGFSGGMLEVGLTFQFNRGQLTSFRM